MDYIDNARLLQYDLTDCAVLMPQNLKYAHDQAEEIVRSIDEKNGYRFPQIAEQEEQYNRLYATANRTLLIRAPHDHQEIIDEGAKLQALRGNLRKACGKWRNGHLVCEGEGRAG